MRKLLPFFAVLVLLMACGGSGGAGEGDASPSAHGGGHAGPDEEGACEDLSGGGQATIVMQDNQFAPACFTVSGDQGLALRNEGAALHDFTVDNVDLSLKVAPSESANTEPIGQVLEAGTYDFHCTLHARMAGEITVA